MKKYCKVCQELIPEARVKLGYSETCVNHSNAFKYVGLVAASGKCDYEISIIRDKETAEHMHRLLETRGVF
jgi:hypothetical protein